MLISNKWLRDYLKTDISNEKISEILTNVGLEVEGIQNFESYKGGFKDVVVGKVKEVMQHNNADKLKICKVDIGTEILNIVCGALNIAIEKYVAVAKEGSVLHMYDGTNIKIEKREVRGVESNGMICSEFELGISNKKDEILIFNKNYTPGLPLNEIYLVFTDTIYEIGLTPNRIDAASHFGVARDIFPVVKKMDKNAKLVSPFNNFNDVFSGQSNLKIEIKDFDKCSRYSGIVIENISIEESSNWIKERLIAVGKTPINNIVDFTNFVLLESGQPLHAFDYDKIEGEKIIVRDAEKDEKFTTLDKIERELYNSDLMIANVNNSMCLAGVFGGINSGITNNTKKIFIESACFSSKSIRNSVKKHDLHTDASFRFERGTDPNMTITALYRIINLLKDSNKNIQIKSKIYDLYIKIPTPINIEFNFNYCNKILGFEIPKKEVSEILLLHNYKILNRNENYINIEVPSYRIDVVREIDIVEELARIYGYNELKSVSNKSIKYFEPLDKYIEFKYEYKKKISEYLIDNGYTENISNSFISQDKFENNINNFVKVQNPLSNELNFLRINLLQSLLENISYNHKHRNYDLKFFEFGRGYSSLNNISKEEELLAIGISGLKYDTNWYNKNEVIDWQMLKLLLQNINKKFGIEKEIILNKKENKSGIYELEIFIENDIIGAMYIFSKEWLKKNFDIKRETIIMEIKVDKILTIAQNKFFKLKETSIFPEIERDIALIVDKKITFKTIKKLILENNNSIIIDVNLFDVFKIEEKDSEKISYAIRIVFSNNERTLNDIEVNEICTKIINDCENKLGLKIRK